MSGYWSKPYTEEILYSVIARNIHYLHTKGPKQLLHGIFGRDTISTTLDLPSGVARLAEYINLGDHHEFQLISKHTLFPYYAHFISNERKSKVLNSMLFKSGNIHTRFGIIAGIFPSLKLPRYCPECNKDALEKIGEIYYRREHQIPSLKICTIHNVYLHQIAPDYYNINKHYYIPPSKITKAPILTYVKVNSNLEVLGFGKRIVSLLKNNQTPNWNHLPYHYNETIKILGFRKGNHSLDLLNIYDSFKEVYSPQLLKHYKCSIDFADPSCWLKKIIRKHRKSFDPVRHLFIQGYFEHLRQNQSKRVNCPSNAIYVCKNPVCKDYRTNRQTTHFIRKDPKSKRNITYVKCACGYSYTKSFIQSNKQTFIRVKEFGSLWETTLIKLLKEGSSQKSISAKLHVDPRTIKSYLNKMDTSPPYISLDKKKEQWMSLKKKTRKHTITELRKLQPALYIFLYRNDKDWLINQNYPIKKVISNTRVDWKERDNLLLTELIKALDSIKSQHPKRRRSVNLLLKLTGKDSMYRMNVKKLPKSSSFLRIETESPESYRKRRLINAYHKMKKTNKKISYWRLLRTAGIRKEYISKDIHSLAMHITSEHLYLSQIA